jgi:hypothetical protein
MVRVAVFISFLIVSQPALAQHALAQPGAKPRAEAIGSANFALTPPRLSLTDGAVRVDGSVCRRANYFGMSPLRIQVESYGADGRILATKNAYLPMLSRRPDQRCGHYETRFDGQSQPISKIRVCVARAGHCPAP